MSTSNSETTVTAICSTVVISPYAALARAYMTEEIQELWLPAPYNLRLNVSGHSLNIFASSQSRGRLKASKPIQVSKAFADQCQSHLATKTALEDQLYTLLGQDRPTEHLTPPHLERCEAVYRQYLKEYRGQIQYGQHVTVIDGENIVRIYDTYEEAVAETHKRAAGRQWLCTEHEKNPNEDSDEEEGPGDSGTQMEI